MPKNWSREDRLHYQNSEVMSELEKTVLNNIKKLDKLKHTTAQVVSDEDTRKMKEVTDTAKELGDQVERTKELLTGAAEDGELEDKSEDELGEDENEIYARQAVIDELVSLSHKAADAGKIVLAYKIERTIEEILEDEHQGR